MRFTALSAALAALIGSGVAAQMAPTGTPVRPPAGPVRLPPVAKTELWIYVSGRGNVTVDGKPCPETKVDSSDKGYCLVMVPVTKPEVVIGAVPGSEAFQWVWNNTYTCDSIVQPAPATCKVQTYKNLRKVGIVFFPKT